MGSPWRGMRALALAFFLLPVLYAVSHYRPHTFLERDASFYALMAHGLVRYHTLDARRVQPASWYDGRNPAYGDVDQAWSNVSVGRHGRWWPKHSFLMPVAAAPLYAAVGPDGLLLFNVAVAGALLVLLLGILGRVASPAASAGAIALFATSPEYLEHVYFFSHDLFVALLATASVWAMLRNKPGAAGVAAGMALWARPPVVLALAPAMVWAIRMADVRGHKSWARFALALAAPLAAAAACNAWMFGSPLTTAYDRILVVHHGHQGVESVRSAFDLGWRQGVHRLLLDRIHGVVWRMPVTLLALGAVPLAWFAASTRGVRLAVVAAALGLLASMAAWTPYRYSDVRFLFPAIGFGLTIVALGLDGFGTALGAAGARLRAMRRRRPTAAVLAVFAFGALGFVLVAPHGRDPHWRLSTHIDAARVWLGDVPCDYLNLHHEAWECSRIEPHAWQWLGVDLDGRCQFGGRDRRAVWAHPSPDHRPKRISVPGVPGGQRAVVEYGIAPTGRGPACFEVHYAGAKVGEACARRPGAWRRLELSLPADQPPGRAELTVVLPAQDAGQRHLCLDVVLDRGPSVRGASK